MKSNSEVLKELSKYHKDFIKMAKVMASSSIEVDQYAEDFVQDAYLKIMQYPKLALKLKTKSKSKGYMFFTIRSLIVSHYRKQKNLKYINTLGDANFENIYDTIEEVLEDQESCLFELEAKVLPCVKENCDWFDYELFRKYLKTNKSIKDLAKESTLGIQTIYRSLRRSKLAIAENLWEDYLDYANGDYSK